VNTYTAERVTIKLSRDDFAFLNFALGIAAGSMSHQKLMLYSLLRLANTVNEGNPQWTPYELVPEASDADTQ
jgi:hypothetical protein